MKKCILLILISSLGSLVFCQEKASKIDSLIMIIAPEAMIDQSLEQGFSSSANSNIPQALKDSIFVYMHELLNEVMDSMKILYEKKFTENEIDELLNFYNSNLGKKSLSLSYDFMTFFNNYRANHMDKFIQKINNVSHQFEIEETFITAKEYSVTKRLDYNTAIKSKLLPLELFYNNNLWTSIPPEDISPVAEICLVNKEKDLYAILITEPTVLSLSQLKKALIINLKKGFQEVNIINQELKNVNGKEILSLLLSAKVNDVDLIYQWYIYTSNKGSMQYVVFTDKNTYDLYKTEFTEILNGLVIKE